MVIIVLCSDIDFEIPITIYRYTCLIRLHCFLSSQYVDNTGGVQGGYTATVSEEYLLYVTYHNQYICSFT